MSIACFCRAMGRGLVFSLLVGLLGGCQPPGSVPVDVTPLVQSGTAVSGTVDRAFMLPGGSSSLATLRARPDFLGEAPTRNILCTAPSPDWATALAMAQQLQGSGGVTGGPTASLTASNSLTETTTALAGRTAGVVALRDGLYKACEAYTNGVIGKDAYALILSQYGNLLVALAGGSGGGGNGPAVAGTAATGGGTTGTTASGTSAQTGGGAAQAGAATVAQMQQGVLQALLVACISEYDPTVHGGERNTLLTADSDGCKSLFKQVIATAPALLKPASVATAAAAPASPRQPAAATPNAAAKAICCSSESGVSRSTRR